MSFKKNFFFILNESQKRPKNNLVSLLHPHSHFIEEVTRIALITSRFL